MQGSNNLSMQTCLSFHDVKLFNPSLPISVYKLAKTMSESVQKHLGTELLLATVYIIPVR